VTWVDEPCASTGQANGQSVGSVGEARHGGHSALGFHHSNKIDINKTNRKHKVDNMVSVNKHQQARQRALAQPSNARA